MMILRVTSILGGQKEDKGMICSIPPDLQLLVVLKCSETEPDFCLIF
jgi:hypothetical protein